MSAELSARIALLLRGSPSAAGLERDVLALCVSAPSAHWEVLGLLDQYYRRGRITQERFNALRQRIERRALGVQEERGACAPAAVRGHVVPRPNMPVRIMSLPPRPAAATAPGPEPAALRDAGAQPQRSRRRGAPAGSIWRVLARASPIVALAVIALGLAAFESLQRPQPPMQATDGAALRPPAHLAATPAPAASSAQATPSVPEPASAASGTAPRISLASDRYVVYPGSRTVEIEILRTGGDPHPQSILWWTQSSGAHANVDYVAAPPALAHFPPGASRMTLRVAILPNPSRRHIAMFDVFIGRHGEGDIGPVRRATVFILPAKPP